MASPRTICWGAASSGVELRSALPEKGWAAGRRPRKSGSRQGGLVQPGCTPHFSFVLPKEKRAVHGPKRKALGALRCSGPPRARGSTYRCLLRFGLTFGHAMVFCEVDTAVPWRIVPTSSGCKNAFDQLLFYCLALRRSQYFRHQCSTGSSFRAFCLPARGTPHP